MSIEGTDAKIAKFLKRGVEVLGLAIIDPVELSPPSTPPLDPSRSPERRLAAAPAPPAVDPSPSSFFSKFKRLTLKPPTLPTLPNLPRSESSHSLTTASGLTVVPLLRTPSTDGERDLHPSVPLRKGYMWSVRKWLRKDLEGKSGLQAAQDLRFEWRRGERRQRAGPPSSNGGSFEAGGGGAKILSSMSSPVTPAGPPAATTSSLHPPTTAAERPVPDGEASTADPNNLVPFRARPKSWAGDPSSVRSRSPAFSDAGHGGPSSDAGHGGGGGTDDDGYESDPEDSERPWTCEVVHGPKGAQRRLLLGTLHPAPHHPKLVAHLKVPFSLSPIPLGVFEPGSGSGNEGLSVEEMKDLVCVTCLWLVVREGLGGLGRRRGGRA